MKAWPTGFHGAPKPVKRWRVYFIDHDPVVVTATDEDAARRAGAFFSYGAVTDVEALS